MTINHLINENKFFTKAYKDKDDNIIINTWEDPSKYTEEYPKNYLSLNTLDLVELTNNKIEEVFSIDDLLSSDYIYEIQNHSINNILLDNNLDINNIFYHYDNIKNNLNVFYKNNIDSKLYPLSKTMKLTKNEKEYKEENSIIFVKQGKKEWIELNNIVDSQYFKTNLPFTMLNDINLNDIDFIYEDQDDQIADSFSIDTLGNFYLTLEGQLKIIKDGKLKNIKEKDIESILLYKDENDNYHSLIDYNFESGVDTFKKLTLSDLERILWGIADIIRDKSSLGDVMDYMKVAIPFVTLKRVLDIKEEWLNNEVLINEDRTTYSNNLNKYSYEEAVKKTIEAKIRNRDVFKLKECNDNWHLLTWQDIVDFQDVQDSELREIKLSKYDLNIKTRAKNVFEFLEEYIAILNTAFEDIFNEMKFIEKLKDSKKLKKEYSIQIINDLNEYSFNFRNASEDVFSAAYMYLISTFASSAGKKGGEFFTPTELTNKLIPFLEIKLKDEGKIKIADPAAGSFSFVLEVVNYIEGVLQQDVSIQNIMNYLNEKIEIIVQEKTIESTLMGKLNLLFKGIHQNSSIIYNDDTIEAYTSTIGSHRNDIDYIVANPPYGLKNYGINYANAHSNEERWKYGVPKKGDGDIAFLLTINDLLNEDGKAGVLLPLGTLFKDSTSHIRKGMLNDDIIEGLVVLPSNMFQTTQIPVVFWILNKNKKEEDKGKIFMVNASEEFIKKGKFNEWQEQKSFTNYKNRTIEEGVSGYISIQDIEENDWNLSVQRYVFKDEPEEIIDIIELNKDIININNDIITKQNDMNLVLSKIMNLGN